MKAYGKTEAIERINSLAEEQKDFIFVIDYAAQQAMVQSLSEVNKEECLFWFNGITNVPTSMCYNNAPFRWNVMPPTEAEYQARFNQVKNQIVAGNSYLANLTCRMEIDTNLSLYDIFMRSTAPYRLWIKDKLVCFSPECFVKMSNGIISSYPMKGTIDATLPHAHEQLMNNSKEAAEHATIVDLIRNDLSMVSTNVTVQRYRYTDRIETHRGAILQTSSEIVGRVTNEYLGRMGSMLFRLLPAGSITGAPKKKTCEIIAAAEGYNRDFYTGVMGCCYKGVLDSAVMIRFVDMQQNQLFFKAGGGITAQSHWHDEYREVIQKAYVATAVSD